MKFKILGAIVFFFILFWAVRYAADYYRTEDIWDAIRKGRVEYVQDYLKHGGEVDSTRTIVMKSGDDDHGHTLLMEAARYGNSDIASMLIRNGANVNAKTTYRTTPLEEAIGNGNIIIIQHLIDKGADVNWNSNFYSAGHTVTSGSPTPLSNAIRVKRFDVVKLLLDAGAQIRSYVDASTQIRSDDIDLAKHLGQHDIVNLLNERLSQKYSANH